VTPGDFAITPAPDAEPSFYVLVYGGILHDDAKARLGFREVGARPRRDHITVHKFFPMVFPLK
jgi:hypothetical protein